MAGCDYFIRSQSHGALQVGLRTRRHGIMESTRGVSREESGCDGGRLRNTQTVSVPVEISQVSLPCHHWLYIKTVATGAWCAAENTHAPRESGVVSCGGRWKPRKVVDSVSEDAIDSRCSTGAMAPSRRTSAEILVCRMISLIQPKIIKMKGDALNGFGLSQNVYSLVQETL